MIRSFQAVSSGVAMRCAPSAGRIGPIAPEHRSSPGCAGWTGRRRCSKTAADDPPVCLVRPWEPAPGSTSLSTTITFTNTSAGYYGAALDDIQVAGPDGASCKSNGWKTMTDSVGHSFKNQGDCVSFFATDGTNLAAG